MQISKLIIKVKASMFELQFSIPEILKYVNDAHHDHNEHNAIRWKCSDLGQPHPVRKKFFECVRSHKWSSLAHPT